MSPSACTANLEFVRLSAEEPSSLYIEKFLSDGSDAWPRRYREQYPALQTWQGVSELKRSLAQVAGAPPDCRVLLANRSAQLMKLAARVFFRVCRNVLATDLSWPSYQTLLEAEAARTGKVVTTLSLRQRLLRDGTTADELTSQLVEQFVGHDCDGLFLTAVDNLGVRLPVQRIVSEVRRRCDVRFVVVDGAQAFCHVPQALSPSTCDLFLAGCHKWLRAYHPMGIAFVGRNRFRQYIERTVNRMTDDFDLDDPLLRFTEQLETGQLDGYTETVSIASLFSCQGAANDIPKTLAERESQFNFRKQNAEIISDVATSVGWRPIRPASEFLTGIVLLQPKGAGICGRSAERLRRAFQDHGVILSAYDDGLIRLSMPERLFADAEVDRIRESLVRASGGFVKRIPRRVTVPTLKWRSIQSTASTNR